MEVDSISAAASALGCSKRTAFRHLKQGRIVKTQNGSFEVSDIAATDSGPDIADNGTVPYKKPFSVSKLSAPDRGKSHVINSLQTELTASRLQFQIEQSEAVRAEWHQRQKASVEQSAMIAAQQAELKRIAKEKQKASKLTRDKLHRAALHALPIAVRPALPSIVVSKFLLAIEKLSPMASDMALSDLFCLADAERDVVLKVHIAEVQRSFFPYVCSMATREVESLAREIFLNKN